VIGRARAEERVLVRDAAQRDQLLDAQREGDARLTGYHRDDPREGGAVVFIERHVVDQDLSSPPRAASAHAVGAAADRSQQRGLARAVRPEQRDHLSRVDACGHFLNRAARPIAQRQVTQLERNAAHSSYPPR